MAVLRDVALGLVAEAVGALDHGGLPSHPERSAQSGIAILRDPASAAEQARLHRRQIHAAELQELTVMPETPQVAGFGQDSQRIDRADA